MLKILISVLALSLVSGCGLLVQTKPMDEDKLADLKGKTLAVTKPHKVNMGLFTKSDALLGIFSTTMSAEEITNRYELPDPAFDISKNVESKLVKNVKMKVTKRQQLKERTGDATEIAGQFDGVDYILDIETINSQMIYKPLAFGEYKLIYRAKLQLVESASKEVVASSVCVVESDENDSHSYDDMVAQNAKLLKKDFNRAANHCTREFTTDILKI